MLRTFRFDLFLRESLCSSRENANRGMEVVRW